MLERLIAEPCGICRRRQPKNGGVERDAARTLRNRKGFTLVELIVVLVILAILASLLVPALTGYIDKAKKSDLLTRAKYAMTAAQAGLSEAYGEGIATNDISSKLMDAIYGTGETNEDAYICIIVGKPYWNGGTGQSDYSATSINLKCYKIYGFCYSESGATEYSQIKEDDKTIFYLYDETTGTGSWDATKEQFDAYNGNRFGYCK